MNTNAAEKLSSTPAQELKAKYEALKEAEPQLRAKDIAERLKVSEGELVACRVGEDIIRLQDDFEAILKSLEPIGELMALTRNEFVVHERKGVYANSNFFAHGPMKQGIFVNPDIDLRLFMNGWAYAFAVKEMTKSGERKSLQFFDKAGLAIHKIYTTSASNEAEYEKVVEKFKAAEQSDSIAISNEKRPEVFANDNEVDWAEFRKAWENLKDTHDFFVMLRKFKISREKALNKIGEDLAYKISNKGARNILDLARDSGCEIMVFVGNPGCIQIHTGPVSKLAEYGPWYNVLDPKFNLHFREDKISACYVVKKPSEDGIITSVEVFDANGELAITFFGKRKPGIPELELWREIVSKLEKAA